MLVIVVANEGQRIDIPDGCVLENSEFLLVAQLRRLTYPSYQDYSPET